MKKIALILAIGIALATFSLLIKRTDLARLEGNHIQQLQACAECVMPRTELRGFPYWVRSTYYTKYNQPLTGFGQPKTLIGNYFYSVAFYTVLTGLVYAMARRYKIKRRSNKV